MHAAGEGEDDGALRGGRAPPREPVQPRERREVVLRAEVEVHRGVQRAVSSTRPPRFFIFVRGGVRLARAALRERVVRVQGLAHPPQQPRQVRADQPQRERRRAAPVRVRVVPRVVQVPERAHLFARRRVRSKLHQRRDLVRLRREPLRRARARGAPRGEQEVLRLVQDEPPRALTRERVRRDEVPRTHRRRRDRRERHRAGRALEHRG
eukprot:30825-Pelagococcus_subviridis.AAC.1